MVNPKGTTAFGWLYCVSVVSSIVINMPVLWVDNWWGNECVG